MGFDRERAVLFNRRRCDTFGDVTFAIPDLVALLPDFIDLEGATVEEGDLMPGWSGRWRWRVSLAEYSFGWLPDQQANYEHPDYASRTRHLSKKSGGFRQFKVRLIGREAVRRAEVVAPRCVD